MVAFPAGPLHTVSVRRVVASQIGTVQVGAVTVFVPPGTFERHCTWAWWVIIVVLVWSAELLSEMKCQWITFRQQVTHKFISQFCDYKRIASLQAHTTVAYSCALHNSNVMVYGENIGLVWLKLHEAGDTTVDSNHPSSCCVTYTKSSLPGVARFFLSKYGRLLVRLTCELWSPLSNAT